MSLLDPTKITPGLSKTRDLFAIFEHTAPRGRIVLRGFGRRGHLLEYSPGSPNGLIAGSRTGHKARLTVLADRSTSGVPGWCALMGFNRRRREHSTVSVLVHRLRQISVPGS